MSKLVREAVVVFRVRFSPPECVMFVVVSPPVIGNVAATGDGLSVAGLTGVMLNPAPVRTDKVDVLKVTVVVPPVIGVAWAAKGMETAAARMTAFHVPRRTLSSMLLLLERKCLTE